MLDTLWVYYSDGTFEQFAAIDDQLVLFSKGTYAFAEDGDFIYEVDETDHGDIIITRTHKYQAGAGLDAYESEHTYDLGTLGFDPLYAFIPDGKLVRVLFYGDDKQPYVESDGDEEMIDTEWFFYSDGTFEQYGEIDDQIVLFSTGTYELSDGADFVYEDDDNGQITINRDQKYQAGSGLGFAGI